MDLPTNRRQRPVAGWAAGGWEMVADPSPVVAAALQVHHPGSMAVVDYHRTAATRDQRQVAVRAAACPILLPGWPVDLDRRRGSTAAEGRGSDRVPAGWEVGLPQVVE